MELNKEKWTSYDSALSTVQNSVNLYIEAINKYKQAIEVRSNKGIMNSEQAMLARELLHKTMISLTEIQQLILKKMRSTNGYFPILNYSLKNDIEDIENYIREIGIEEGDKNYTVYHFKKVPITYPSIEIKRAEPKDPWLAHKISCDHDE